MILILTYHSVADSDYAVAVSPENFSAQLAYLKRRGFRFVRASELRDLIGSRAHRDKRIACVTFDDCAENIYTTAFPLLRKSGVPASLFLSTGFVGAASKNGGALSGTFLAWDEIREMHSSGLVEIQNHTDSHRVLTLLEPAQMDEEIRIAGEKIEKAVGAYPRVMSYPKNAYDARVSAAAARHCVAGLGAVGIIDDEDTPDLYALPRVPVHNNVKFWKFVLRTKPWFWKLQQTRRYLFS